MKKLLLTALATCAIISPLTADELSMVENRVKTEKSMEADKNEKYNIVAPQRKSKLSRLSLGGYGEAVYSRHFYSDNFNRYFKPSKYSGTRGHGQMDLPHVVLFVGYDFGKGWSMGSEIEFEHGGTEAAVELEGEETGEWEQEIERGGEVALEQFWLQKKFSSALHLRAGHMVVPVGYTNAHHLPNQFFTVYRPEGESSMMPCTWHQTGLSLWGTVGDWRYEAMVVSSLSSVYFNNTNWIKKGAHSPLEFTPANKLAGAFRVDNYSVKGLRLGMSGYVGQTFNNTIQSDEGRYKDVKGLLMLGAFDFNYNDYNWIIRGNADYGFLHDADKISQFNRTQSKNSPYAHTHVGKAAVAIGVEAGYNIFSQIEALRKRSQQLYLFARYDYYDTYIPTKNARDYSWSERQCMTVGLNYRPIGAVTIKAEYAKRFLKKQYNNEPSISLGVTYAGHFL